MARKTILRTRPAGRNPPPDALYAENLPLLRGAALYTARRFRGDAEELFAEAGLIFAQALRAWRPGRASFRTLLTWKLRRLADGARRDARRGKRAGVVAARLGLIADPVGPDPTADLSADGLAVLKLALLSREGMRTAAIRAAVKRVLRRRGWSPRRVRAAFAEIRGVFS